MFLQFPGEGPQIPFFQQRANPLVGQVQLLQAAQQKDLLNLAVLIVAVAVLSISIGGLEKPLLVIVSQLFGGDIAEVGHLPTVYRDRFIPYPPMLSPPVPVWFQTILLYFTQPFEKCPSLPLQNLSLSGRFIPQDFSSFPPYFSHGAIVSLTFSLFLLFSERNCPISISVPPSLALPNTA